MSRTPTHPFLRTSHLIPLAMLAMVVSFGIGIKTAGNVQTIQLSSATDDNERGDVTQDSIVDVRDAILILEISQGYRAGTLSELDADPNGNGTLTVDDAIRVLRTISAR